MADKLTVFKTTSPNMENKTEKAASLLRLPERVKIGKSVYLIHRHFSGERDIREAVYAAVKNEAFRAANQ